MRRFGKAAALTVGSFAAVIVLRSLIWPVSLGDARLDGEWQFNRPRSQNVWASDRIPEQLVIRHEMEGEASRIHVIAFQSASEFQVAGRLLEHALDGGESPFPVFVDHSNVWWRVRGPLWPRSNDVLQITVPVGGARGSLPLPLVLVYERL